MSAYQVRPSTDPLERERREVERRRVRLEERRQRVLQAKSRLIGVDTAALAQQVDERRRRETEEARRELHFDHTAVAQASAVTHLVGKAREAELLTRADLSFFQQRQAQEKRLREEAEAARRQVKEEPSRVFLQFLGEDRQAKERERLQRLQQRDWATAQVRQLERREEKERVEEADYEHYQQQIRQMQAANEQRKAEAELQAAASLQSTNRSLAAQKAATERLRASAEAHAEAKELSHTAHSRFMTEQVRPADTGYCYKGMSDAQRQEVLDGVWRQQEERRQARQKERAADAAYDVQQAEYRRALVLADIDRKRREQTVREAVKEERLRQRQEKVISDRHLNEVVYTNPVDDAFFQQFGTSCR